MSPRCISVINPNSSQSVTDGIAAAIADLDPIDDIEVRCETLSEGPPAIESDADCAAVVGPLTHRISHNVDHADVHVIACYSDPGLAEATAAANTPVLGIAESAMRTAVEMGERFGVISILDASIPRHLKYVDALGLTSHLAGDRAVGLGVLELEAAADGLERMIETGRKLRDVDGAGALVLGCAGMASARREIHKALDIPVIEPCQAAVQRGIRILNS